MKNSKRIWIRSILCAAALASLNGIAFGQGQPIKIGLLATLEGPFAAGGADGMRGAELAVKQRGGVVAGRKIEIIKASSDAKPDVAVNATRKLVEQDKVDIMVGPLSGGEGIAVKFPLDDVFGDFVFAEWDAGLRLWRAGGLRCIGSGLARIGGLGRGGIREWKQTCRS